MMTSKGSVGGKLLPTSIVYTKQNLQNADSIVKANNTFRIQFKQTDFGDDLVDLCNTALHFELDIPTSVANSINAQIYNDDVQNIFSVQQISLQGQSLKMQYNDMSNSIIHRVTAKYTQSDKQLLGGLDKHTMEYQALAYIETDSNALIATVGDQYFKPVEFIRDVENRKKLKLIKRQFDIDAGTNKLTAKAANVSTKNYSVKLGDLCPELQSFKYCSAKLFQGQGLEITVKLLPSDVCTSALYKTEAVTAGLCAEKLVELTISNVYLSVVHMANLSIPLMKALPYTTYHHISRSLRAGELSVNLPFSMMGQVFCKGFFITHNPTSKKLDDDGKGTSVLIPAKSKYESIMAPFTTGQKNYCQLVDVDKFNLQIGLNSFPRSMPPVSASCQSLQIAGQMSEQIFGLPLGVSFEKFMTLDYVLYVPVNQVISSGTQCQLYISYLTDKAGFDLNLFAVCDKIIEMADDFSLVVK